MKRWPSGHLRWISCRQFQLCLEGKPWWAFSCKQSGYKRYIMILILYDNNEDVRLLFTMIYFSCSVYIYINMYCRYYVYFLAVLLLHFFSPAFSAGSHPKGRMETCQWSRGHLNPYGLETSLRMLCTILLLKPSLLLHMVFCAKKPLWFTNI